MIANECLEGQSYDVINETIKSIAMSSKIVGYGKLITTSKFKKLNMNSVYSSHDCEDHE